MRRNNTKEGEVIENRERKARGEREKRKNNRTGGQKRGRKKGDPGHIWPCFSFEEVFLKNISNIHYNL